MGASVFLVEDEALIRMMLVDMIEQLGHSVTAEAGDVERGNLLAASSQYDFAVLDINVGGSLVEPIATTIATRGIPFFFISGYGSAGVPKDFAGTPVLRKPCSIDELRAQIDQVLSRLPRDGASNNPSN